MRNLMASVQHFNPRSPHGERRGLLLCLLQFPLFQSTLPARGATNCCKMDGTRKRDFNPRSPHGERRPWISA